jgi:hypothetical protein
MARVGRPDGRRLRLAAVLLLLLLAPALAAAVLGLGSGGLYLVVGTIVVAPVGLTLGQPVALATALGAGRAAFVTFQIGSDPLLAGGWMALLGLAVGLAATRGVEAAVAGIALIAAIIVGAEGDA